MVPAPQAVSLGALLVAGTPAGCLPTHHRGSGFIGDDIDIDSSVDCAWPVWVDTRHEKADVMTACIERPGEVVG